MNEQADTAGETMTDQLGQRARQFLLHSFLYYRLGESLVDDAAFDRWSEELRKLHASHPELPLPHAALLEPALGPESSGFQIRGYPPEIITAAFVLLYQAQEETQAAGMTFTEFVERRGYRVATT